MRLRTLIVDDEPVARKILREELELVEDVEIVAEADSGAVHLKLRLVRWRIADDQQSCSVMEASIGKEATEELAVMVDTFHPLRITKQAAAMDDDRYPYSWLPPEDGGAEAKELAEEAEARTSAEESVVAPPFQQEGVPVIPGRAHIEGMAAMRLESTGPLNQTQRGRQDTCAGSSVLSRPEPAVECPTKRQADEYLLSDGPGIISDHKGICRLRRPCLQCHETLNG